MKKVLVLFMVLFCAIPAFAVEEPEQSGIVAHFTMEDWLSMDKDLRNEILKQTSQKEKNIPEAGKTKNIPEVGQVSDDTLRYDEFKSRTTSIIAAIHELFVMILATMNDFIKSPAGFLAALIGTHRMGVFSSAWKTLLYVIEKRETK